MVQHNQSVVSSLGEQLIGKVEGGGVNDLLNFEKLKLNNNYNT